MVFGSVFINILEATSSRSYSWIPLAGASSGEIWIYQSYQFWVYDIVPSGLRSALDSQCVISLTSKRIDFRP